jgi:glycerate kinase
VQGPLSGQRVNAIWAWDSKRKSAIVESAQAAGIGLIPTEQRHPGETTTHGVGELLLAALDAGAGEIIVGVGGTGTNDGGAGMAVALGVRLSDIDGRSIPQGGVSLEGLASIDVSGLDARLSSAKVIAATDVTNPLLGPGGAVHVFAPQKGADAAEVERLERAMNCFAMVIRRDLGKDFASVSGAGAGGGLGLGLLAFCNARIQSGIETVLDRVGFRDLVRKADLVLTGEGQIDEQTGFGKALDGIMREAERANVRTAAIVGRCAGPHESFVGPGRLAALASLEDAMTSRKEAMRDAALLVERRTSELLRSIDLRV